MCSDLPAKVCRFPLKNTRSFDPLVPVNGITLYLKREVPSAPLVLIASRAMPKTPRAAGSDVYMTLSVRPK